MQGWRSRYVMADACQELASTPQVVLRRLREQGGPDYLNTGLAAARSRNLGVARSAAIGMAGMDYTHPATSDDLAILDELARHADWHVRETVIWALSFVGKHPSREQDAIERILAFSPGENKKLADKICDAFIYNRIPLGNLSESQLVRLLQNLAPVSDLDEHGIGMVLNWAVGNRPSALIGFVKKRIVRASERRAAGDWSYDIVPRHRSQIHLHGLRDSGELPAFRAAVLRQIEEDQYIRDELITLLWAMGTTKVGSPAGIPPTSPSPCTEELVPTP